MRVLIASVPTENASSFLRKLCQHWSHKFTVSYDDRHGWIELPAATYILDTADHSLNARMELKEEANQARVEKVVEEHLQRFGFRETLVFSWNSAQV